jgi:hypothetical protein
MHSSQVHFWMSRQLVDDRWHALQSLADDHETRLFANVVAQIGGDGLQWAAVEKAELADDVSLLG